MFKFCTTCEQETLFVTEALYEGFKKTGECSRCSVCGNSSSVMKESAPRTDPLAALFGENSRPEKPELFDVEGETARLCRKCTHYVIHPFTQRCGLHDREVSATDTCDQFKAKADEK